MHYAVFLVLLLCCGAAAHAQQTGQIQEINRIVAVVNDDVIVRTELDEQLRQVRAQLADSGTPAPPSAVLEKQVLERLILGRLQIQIAESAGIRIDDEELNATVAQIAQSNGLSIREFRDILESDGYSFSQFREQMREQLIISQVRQRSVESRVTVSQRDVENFLVMQSKRGDQVDEYRLQHILIALPEGASPEQIAAAKENAQSVLDELRDGADFAELAVAVSDGQRALDGGDLGWRKASQLPSIFADAVPELSPGELSDLIRSPAGFHIVKLAERSSGGGGGVVTQTHARHILVKTDALISDEEAETRLWAAKERFANGEDFADLAQSMSQDRASAIKGGDLGWTSPGQFVPTFEAVMASLQPGEVSDPFESQFGWHIILVEDRRQQDNSDEVRRAMAYEELSKRKADEEAQAWLRQIRDEAYVEYRLDE